MALNIGLPSGYIEEFKELFRGCCCREIILQKCCAKAHRLLLFKPQKSK